VINRSLARRYAQALMELAETDSASIADRLAQFNELLEANPILKEVLVSPAFRMDERKRVFDQIISRLGWGKPLDRFLWYLVEHRRMVFLGAIVESFLDKLDRAQGRVRVQVTSAQQLDETVVANLKKALADGLKKEVIVETQVEPRVLAGVQVRIGDLVVDGSLRTQLNNLKDVLTKH